MRRIAIVIIVTMLLAGAGCGAPGPAGAPAAAPPASPERRTAMDEQTISRVEQALVEQHGSTQAERIRRGLRQVADRWRTEDGDGAVFEAFVREHFIVEPEALDAMARHLEYALEMIDGHHLEIEREISRFQILDEEPLQPVDSLLAAYSPAAHVSEDLFQNKIAFVVLLNLPLTTLEERVRQGYRWSRRTWARARLAQRFELRIPADVLQHIERVSAAADQYIDSYNIHLDRLATVRGHAGFPEGKKLISHWGLRDEIRALYSQPDGLHRQRLIALVMARIIRQEIPAEVVDSAVLEWDPEQNQVRRSPSDGWRSAPREPDRRYQHLLDGFRARRRLDPHVPSLPTHIARAFDRDREITEPRMRGLLESVLRSATAQKVGALVARRLGRPLEPFDLWYAGFRVQGSLDEAVLDEITRQRYPNAAAFQQDLPRIIAALGFSADTVGFLADHIVVDAARGAGHAAGAQRRDDRAHLRTRISPEGMDYKGFNIAIHELGHNVEQVFSMSRIDHTLLEGVPNTGFTEAFAFLFQAHDLELLGQDVPAGGQADSLRALDRFWSTYEIAGVAMLDLAIWHWMYAHPDATAAELRAATVRLAKEIWNEYYAPVFGVRDVVLPAIYSHIIAYGLYTPDYPLGFLITSQVEAYVRTRDLPVEMERMCRLGQLAPDVWMQQAVGEAISSQPMLAAAEAALAQQSRGAQKP